MIKYKLFWIISAILTFIIILSSCNGSISLDISTYHLINADIETCSTFIIPMKDQINEASQNTNSNLKGGLNSIKIDHTLNYIGAVILPLTAVINSNNFDLYPVLDLKEDIDIDVKSFEVEVNNDVT